MEFFLEIGLRRKWKAFGGRELGEGEWKEVSSDTIENLIDSDNLAKLREFAANWGSIYTTQAKKDVSDFQEQVQAVSDTRTLIMLALEFKRKIDDCDYSKESFESLGVDFYSVDEDSEQARLHYLISSNELAHYLRSTNDCERIEREYAAILRKSSDEKVPSYCQFAPVSYASGAYIAENNLYLPSQKEEIEVLNSNDLYPVLTLFGGNFLKESSYSERRAYFFMDSLINACIHGLSIYTRDGELAAGASTIFTSLWVCLIENLRTSRITRCRACGRPIIVTDERGTKRLYCNNGCKRKYKRALRFKKLVNDGMPESEAAKAAGIAAATAYHILENF